MIDPSLALQELVGARLVASSDVTDLVPAYAIFDKSKRPEIFPCIIVGTGDTTYADDYQSFHDRLNLDLHVWVQEPGLAQVKAIAGAVREALRHRPWSAEGVMVHSLIIANAHYMRDPSGEHSHAVVSVEAIVKELAS